MKEEWKPDLSLRRVVCAAVRDDVGNVVLGIRHFSPDMRELINRTWNGDFHRFRDQGFVDQFGLYLTREEAWLVAQEKGQLIEEKVVRRGADIYDPNGTLYSEDLY